jgi:uncharacterized Fe-S cluster-containing radical SAM superfamily protein
MDQPLPITKFSDPEWTAKGEKRAHVELKALETLWFNTGTLCNLTCGNCYIESSPKNDRLVYLTLDDVRLYLDEITAHSLPTREIGLTGGEPFMNPAIIAILELCLSRGFDVLLLTNAMRPMMKLAKPLAELNHRFGPRLCVRVSVDHYTQALHEEERGANSWQPTLDGLIWLAGQGFNLSAAGRTRWGESEAQLREGYDALFKAHGISINAHDPARLVLFPEMDDKVDVPEITTDCWRILNKSPDSVMCASARMVVKRKGEAHPKVLACTLLAYDEAFTMGTTLEEASRPVALNHPHCAKFCVLGGASCS